MKPPPQWPTEARMSGILTPCMDCGHPVISAPLDPFWIANSLEATDPALSVVVDPDPAPVGCRDPVAHFHQGWWKKPKPWDTTPPSGWSYCAHRLHHCTPNPDSDPTAGNQLTLL